MSVRIAGVVLPAKVLKQGSAEDVDLSMLLIDEKKLPAWLPKMQLCEAPPWPTDPVIIVDARRPHSPTSSRRRCCLIRGEQSFLL